MAANPNDVELINRLDFIDDQERAYFAAAQLGEQAREFLASPVGRYLHGRAKLDYENAKNEMLDADVDSFFGRRKLRRLQKEAERASLLMRYLADALMEAQVAANELETYRK